MSNSEPEEDFAALFAQHEARHAVERGQVVKGRVIQISDEHVFVDVGGKGEAWIDRAELTDEEGRLKIKGGYEVTVGGLRAFCPFSQMELRRVESEHDYVGRVLSFRVTRFGEGGRNIVLSRRALLEEEAAKTAEQTRKKLVPEAVLPGTVVSLADFGAFVDLGGVQGLVPMSELSHARVERASDRLTVGEQVTVKVLLVPNAELGTTRGADHRRMFPAGSEMKVLVLAIEDGGRRIRLSREKALAHEEQAETQAYIKDAARKGGFGMTLGDFLKGR